MRLLGSVASSIAAGVLFVLIVPVSLAESPPPEAPDLPPEADGGADEGEKAANEQAGGAVRGVQDGVNETTNHGRKQADDAREGASGQIEQNESMAEAEVKETHFLLLNTAHKAVDTATATADGLVQAAASLADSLLKHANTFLPGFRDGGSFGAPAAGPSAAAKAAAPTTGRDTSSVIVLVAASTGAAFLSYILLRRLASFTIIPMLSRIAHSQIYDNEARRTIGEMVLGEPGLCLNEIVSRTGYSRNAVSYHLFVLEKEEEIVSVKDGKYRRYFGRNGKYVNGAKNVVAALRNDTTLRLAQSILAKPGSIQRDLYLTLGSMPSATCWHAKRLLDLGVIRKERVANTVRYFPGEILAKYDFSEFGLDRQAPAAPVSASPLLAISPRPAPAV